MPAMRRSDSRVLHCPMPHPSFAPSSIRTVSTPLTDRLRRLRSGQSLTKAMARGRDGKEHPSKASCTNDPAAGIAPFTPYYPPMPGGVKRLRPGRPDLGGWSGGAGRGSLGRTGVGFSSRGEASLMRRELAVLTDASLLVPGKFGRSQPREALPLRSFSPGSRAAVR
jgi:hypothetical protein